MVLSKKSIRSFPFLGASTLLAVLTFATPSVHAGKWAEHTVNGEIDKARAIAKAKRERYYDIKEYFSDNKRISIENYIKKHSPQIYLLKT